MTNHKRIRNILLASTSVICFGFSGAIAAENVVKLGAVVEAQSVCKQELYINPINP